MEFSSSSSDTDLEEELNRNYRREWREQRGIVRTTSSARSQARRYTLPDGHTVEVRRGCIYIPSREIYVHVLQALRCPQKWFGDGRIPLRRRSTLSPELVKLIRVEDTTGAPHQDGMVSLADASDNGFFVFQEVQGSAFVVAPTASPATVEVPPHTFKQKRLCDPLVDTRFQRMMQPSKWRFALKHVPALHAYRRDVWGSTEVTLLSHEVCCYDEYLGILWKFNAQDGILYIMRYVEATATLTQTQFATVPFPPQSCMGMQLSLGRKESDEASAASYHLVIAGVSHLAIVSLSINSSQRRGTYGPQVALTRVQTVALRLSNVTCWGTQALDGTSQLPEVWIGAGRSVFKFSQRDSGEWSKSRIATFATTDVTALTVQATKMCTPAFAIAGMRNGTLQLIADGTRQYPKFDTIVRHRGSDIRFIYTVPDAPYSFVSIARDGETKVWDARLLREQKDPVQTLLTSRPGGGQAGVCSAALAGNVLAVSSSSTGLTCLDLPLYTTLFHTELNISSTTRITMGTMDSVAYNLFTFSPYFTQRFELCGWSGGTEM